jgi:streptogramin lyase
MIEQRASFSLRRYSKLCATLVSTTLIALAFPLLAGTASATVTYTAVVTTGLVSPYQVAFNNGNMYIAGGDADEVQEVTATQLASPPPYAPTNVASHSSRVTTVAFDSSGDLWFGDQGGGGVYEITAAQLAGTLPTTPTAMFTVPTHDANSIAFDRVGDLFVTDDQGHVYEVAAGQLDQVTPVVTTVATLSGSDAASLVFDPSGNLWISNYNGGGGIDEIMANQLGGALITTATNIVTGASSPEPWGVVFDPQGDLFFADVSGFVGEVTASQLQSGSAPYTPTTLAAGFSSPVDLTFGPSGNLFLADFGASTIWELNYVAPQTPTVTPVTGLSVSETSGSISGSWYPNGTATSFTCTLMFGFNDPSTYSETSSATSCTFAVNSSTPWGISVKANNSSGSSSADVAFGAAFVAPTVKKVKKVTSIACTNGKHSKRVYGSPPTCPNGWRRK